MPFVSFEEFIHGKTLIAPYRYFCIQGSYFRLSVRYGQSIGAGQSWVDTTQVMFL